MAKTNLINLHNIDLSNNEIPDIDVLEFMNCPNLESIDLSLNDIKDITVFERINFPQLNELSFANNYFDHEIIKNCDIITNLRKKGIDVKIWGSVRQFLYNSLK